MARCCRFERSNLNKTATALVCSKSLKTKFPERDSAHIFTHTLSAPRLSQRGNKHTRISQRKSKATKKLCYAQRHPSCCLSLSLSLTHTHSLSLCALLCCAVDVAASQSQSPSTLQSLRCFCAALSPHVCQCVCVGERVSLAYGGCDSRCFAIGTQESSACMRVCVCVSACAGFACVCVCAACCFWRKKKQTVAAAFFSTAQIAQLAAGCNRALMCVRV